MTPQGPVEARSLRPEDVAGIARVARRVHGPGTAVVQQQVLDTGERVVRVIDGADRTAHSEADLFLRAQRMTGALREAGYDAQVKPPAVSLWYDVEVTARLG